MCDWCGHDHDVTALCTKRPTWGRRGFLTLLGMAGLAPLIPDLMPVAAVQPIQLTPYIGSAVYVFTNNSWNPITLEFAWYEA